MSDHLERVAGLPCEWRDVPGYGDMYAASDTGLVFRKERIVRRKHPRTGRETAFAYKGGIASQFAAGRCGHLFTTLRYSKTRTHVQVGRLVLMAFRGLPTNGHECCHNNGIPTDNRLTNLRWDTHISNHHDMKLHGTDPSGERHHAALLTDNIVRSLRSGELSIADVMRSCGMKRHSVWKALTGRTWGHVR